MAKQQIKVTLAWRSEMQVHRFSTKREAQRFVSDVRDGHFPGMRIFVKKAGSR